MRRANLDQIGGEGPSAGEAELLLVEFVGEGLGAVGDPLREHVRLLAAAEAQEVDEILPFKREPHGDVGQGGHGVHGGDATDSATMSGMGATVERGYGAEHKRLRAAWAPVVARGGVACRRCGLPIPAGGEWDLGHHDVDRSLPAAPEHRRCNRRAAALMKQLGWRHQTPQMRAEAWAQRYEADERRLAAERQAAPIPRIY